MYASFSFKSSAGSKMPGTQQTLRQTCVDRTNNKWLRNKNVVPGPPWGKASHHLNDVKDEKQDERSAPGSGGKRRGACLWDTAEPSSWRPVGRATHVWHLMFTASTTGVLGPAGLHGSEQLPVTADRDSLDVRNRSRAGKDVLNRQSERVSGS